MPIRYLNLILLLLCMLAAACASPAQPEAPTQPENPKQPATPANSREPFRVAMAFPLYAPPGSALYVRGTGFTTAHDVSLRMNNTQLAIISIQHDEIVAILPEQVQTAEMFLWHDGVATSLGTAYITMEAGATSNSIPAYIFPTAGQPGDTITLYGWHLDNEAGNITARFGKSTGTIIVVDSSRLHIVVPPNAEDTLVVTGRTFLRGYTFKSTATKPNASKPRFSFDSVRISVVGINTRIERAISMDGSPVRTDTLESAFTLDEAILLFTGRVRGKYGIDTLTFSRTVTISEWPKELNDTKTITITWDTTSMRFQYLRYRNSHSERNHGVVTSQRDLYSKNEDVNITLDYLTLTPRSGGLLVGEASGGLFPGHFRGYVWSSSSASRYDINGPVTSVSSRLLEVLPPTPDAAMQVTLY